MAELNKVCIIGNNGNGQLVSDGGRIKIRIYKELLLNIGIDSYIVDLDGWKSHILRTIKKIKNAIKARHVILIMAGPKGSRALIPIVNYLNRKIKTRVVFCPLGIGTLEKKIKHLSSEQVTDFLNCKNTFGIKDIKMKKELTKLDLIFPQNEVLGNCYRKFYGLENVSVLNNFRNIDIVKKDYNLSGQISLIFISRVCVEKGIFDLIETVKEINNDGDKVKLSIYGDIQLNEIEQKEFFSNLSDNIQYLGVANNEDSVEILRKYDLFVLPTKYVGEGTPGSLIEAFLSGTPALISSYSQANLLVTDSLNGFIFEINNKESLKKKIIEIYSNKEVLEKIGLEAQKEAIKYTFKYNKNSFVNCIMGERQWKFY